MNMAFCVAIVLWSLLKSLRSTGTLMRTPNGEHQVDSKSIRNILTSMDPRHLGLPVV